MGQGVAGCPNLCPLAGILPPCGRFPAGAAFMPRLWIWTCAACQPGTWRVMMCSMCSMWYVMCPPVEQTCALFQQRLIIPPQVAQVSRTCHMAGELGAGGRAAGGEWAVCPACGWLRPRGRKAGQHHARPTPHRRPGPCVPAPCRWWGQGCRLWAGTPGRQSRRLDGRTRRVRGHLG